MSRIVRAARGRMQHFAGAWLVAALVGCGGTAGPFVWVDEYAPARTAPTSFAIASGDLLDIQVWGSDKLSTKARVRPDGRIAVPLVGDLVVVDRTPTEVARDLEKALRDQNILIAPRVTVSVEETRPMSVAVLGAVTRAGTFELARGAGVAEAIASAGGLTEFAHRDRIFVIRRTPTPVRIRFTFDALTGQSGSAPVFRLQTGDVVVAE